MNKSGSDLSALENTAILNDGSWTGLPFHIIRFGGPNREIQLYETVGSINTCWSKGLFRKALGICVTGAK